MVNAELQHNPYLLETEVKFNGQEPKINSQIEKYENKLLADWVRDVPKMFYDEMNGYDFDLFFSGTEYDFQKLQQTFISLGVTSDQVRLIMRNELEDAEIKSNEIRNLIDWLKENRNRQFDFDNFYDANRGLLEETFSCIVIRGKDEVPEDLTFTLENVKSVDEIAGTNLTYVPVVFVIEAETIQLFRNDLLALFGRKEVEQNQLFFCISPAMDKEYVVRFISDLGIEEPQLISRIDDGNVATYIKNYPMVAYVGEVIRVFENEVNTLDDRLKAKNEQSAIENAEVYEQISALEDVIEKIKASDMRFVDLDNYSGGNRFNDLKTELEEMIRKWKSRKTKVVGDVEIDRNSTEYEQELARYLGEFYRKAIEHFGFEKDKIEREFNEIYLRQPLDSEYKPEGLEVTIPDNVEVNGIKSVLLELQEERYEEKTDFLDFFKAKSSNEPKELVRVVTCYLEKWREKAIELMIPVVEQYISESQENLKRYYDELAGKYHTKLSELHELKMNEKIGIASQLSEDERMLQADNDWLVVIKDQLARIERG
ncbi:hypothetical protein B5G11_04075 [Drancourtella sp. An57]|uniref:hypothetical protein n=1 Tax=Drancourtella sp. An57 TaxID=1965647 RepID=UPI000B375E23|nr:hypothetical protein [Drancourtella sp. An57]OUN70931.1 hypothetical protein B5G11_04075 [Drancourtella sp. An57]